MTISVELSEIGDYIGRELGPTEWFELSQDRIDQFAELTNDHQFIHVDAEKAAQTPLGTTIAHGFFSLSMLSSFLNEFSVMINGTKMGLNYGLDKVRFLSPVKSGKRIRGKASITDVSEKQPGQVLIRYHVVVEIEGEDKPALIADWLGLMLID